MVRLQGILQYSAWTPYDSITRAFYRTAHALPGPSATSERGSGAPCKLVRANRTGSCLRTASYRKLQASYRRATGKLQASFNLQQAAGQPRRGGRLLLFALPPSGTAQRSPQRAAPLCPARSPCWAASQLHALQPVTSHAAAITRPVSGYGYDHPRCCQPPRQQRRHGFKTISTRCPP